MNSITLMAPEQRYYWRVVLELKLRKCSGDAFQDFFSTLMGKLYGSDFIRLRAYGRSGDKGCDGYRLSCGHVYQCYGALNGDKKRVGYLIKKMGDDFATAKSALKTIMKEWHMVHNIVDGLPTDAILKLEQLKTENKKYGFGFIGFDGIEEKLFNLSEDHIQELLGIAATTHDMQNLQTSELRAIINEIGASSEVPGENTVIKPVPVDKLKFNHLPAHWHFLISSAWQNAHLVASYFSNHPDPMTEEKTAQKFRLRYQQLKSENLAPGEIMTRLYEWAAGPLDIGPQRQIALYALLSFLFESCDIFEDAPK